LCSSRIVLSTRTEVGFISTSKCTKYPVTTVDSGKPCEKYSLEFFSLLYHEALQEKINKENKKNLAPLLYYVRDIL
jgi:hypothetical protein